MQHTEEMRYDEFMRRTFHSFYIACVLLFLTTHASYADPGTCTATKQDAGRGGFIAVVSQNNCSTGYEPKAQIINNSATCSCQTSASTSCSQNGASCKLNGECQTGSACSNFVCVGYTPGVTAFGQCQEQSQACGKLNAVCSTNADCQSGATCSTYTCWSLDGGRKMCEPGQQPAANPPANPAPMPNPCDNNGDYSSCDTALGSIAATPANFIRSAYTSILSMSGGIAVILIILSGYSMMTSQGNPEKVKAAQERLTAAIVGLLFIIFSFVILQVIGVDILALPGLT